MMPQARKNNQTQCTLQGDFDSTWFNAAYNAAIAGCKNTIPVRLHNDLTKLVRVVFIAEIPCSNQTVFQCSRNHSGILTIAILRMPSDQKFLTARLSVKFFGCGISVGGVFKDSIEFERAIPPIASALADMSVQKFDIGVIVSDGSNSEARLVVKLSFEWGEAPLKQFMQYSSRAVVYEFKPEFVQGNFGGGLEIMSDPEKIVFEDNIDLTKHRLFGDMYGLTKEYRSNVFALRLQLDTQIRKGKSGKIIWGKSGWGKTNFVKELARELNCKFIEKNIADPVSGSDFFNSTPEVFNEETIFLIDEVDKAFDNNFFKSFIAFYDRIPKSSKILFIAVGSHRDGIGGLVRAIQTYDAGDDFLTRMNLKSISSIPEFSPWDLVIIFLVLVRSRYSISDSVPLFVEKAVLMFLLEFDFGSIRELTNLVASVNYDGNGKLYLIHLQADASKLRLIDQYKSLFEDFVEVSRS
jgi:hypothetical protein